MECEDHDVAALSVLVSVRHSEDPRLLRAHLFVTLRDGMARGKAFRKSPVPVVPGEPVLPTARSFVGYLCVSGRCFSRYDLWRCYESVVHLLCFYT